MEAFESNPTVSFGDINLSKDRITGHHNPGAGGWPTVRYFNKDTGYEGASYKKKTRKSMCDELGDKNFMQAYVEEAGQTSLCSLSTGAGCSKKETMFIEKAKQMSAEQVSTQLRRLQKVSQGKMVPSQSKWMFQRMAILRQMPTEKEEL